MSVKSGIPEGPARHLDVSRQKVSPHCLEAISDGVRVRFPVRFQAVKVPISGGFPDENPTKKANRLKALLRGISLSEYGSEGFRSTVEAVVRVRLLT